MKYANKNSGVELSISEIQEVLCDLHPSDKSIALREVAKWCEDEAVKRDMMNDFNGVPER